MCETIPREIDETFLNATTTEATSTEYAAIPENEYNAVVHKIDLRTPKDSVILEIHWALDAPGVEDAEGKVARMSIFLDTTADGQLAVGKGKNVKLGRVRTALGQNEAGTPWAPSMMMGAVARIKVTNSAGKDGQIYSNVTEVTKA